MLHVGQHILGQSFFCRFPQDVSQAISPNGIALASPASSPPRAPSHPKGSLLSGRVAGIISRHFVSINDTNRRDLQGSSTSSSTSNSSSCGSGEGTRLAIAGLVLSSLRGSSMPSFDLPGASPRIVLQDKGCCTSTVDEDDDGDTAGTAAAAAAVARARPTARASLRNRAPELSLVASVLINGSTGGGVCLRKAVGERRPWRPWKQERLKWRRLRRL